MNKIEVKSNSDKIYPQFKRLYEESFPLAEQRTEFQQKMAFESERYRLICHEENNVLAGFISYWDFDNFIYIEHFAVNKDLRGRGYGFKIMEEFKSATDKILVLEIDKITDAQSAARLRFYKKCGFFENPHKHSHPGYGYGLGECPMLILSTQRQITSEEYAKFYSDLKNLAMRH